VRDGSGTTQVTLKKGSADPAWFELLGALPRESVVAVEGTVAKSARAHRGLELLPKRLEVLTRSETPLPLGIVDKVPADLDTRLNHRVLDLRKVEVRAVFELRAALLEGFRRALGDQGFLEVETPKLLRQGAEGGATLFAVDYFGAKAFLAQSPQLYKQMLIGAGFERVFEIAPAFRAEPSDTVRHITEFTSLDGEMAFIDGAEAIRGALETAVARALAFAKERGAERFPSLAERIHLPPTPFPRIRFEEAEAMVGRPAPAGRDLGTEEEKRLGELMRERHGASYYFVIDYPTSVKAQTFYAQRKDDDPAHTGYFDLAAEGLELASGGPREHRIDRLDANLRSAGLDPANFEGYREAFRFGMPPHGGFGFGLDRLVQVAAGLSNIREARLFPRDRYRLDP
jgi:nondiscriminating aspartyl-tRNA synthetase